MGQMENMQNLDHVTLFINVSMEFAHCSSAHQACFTTQIFDSVTGKVMSIQVSYAVHVKNAENNETD